MKKKDRNKSNKIVLSDEIFGDVIGDLFIE